MSHVTDWLSTFLHAAGLGHRFDSFLLTLKLCKNCSIKVPKKASFSLITCQREWISIYTYKWMGWMGFDGSPGGADTTKLTYQGARLL